MKICTGCKENKPDDSFYFDRSKGRLMSRCRECESARKKLQSHKWIETFKKKHGAQSWSAVDTDRDRRRRSLDPQYRLKKNLRRLIRHSFQRGGYTKKSRTHAIIGCDFDVFKAHIESQFTDGMSWDLVGRRIHIDHIVPLASASTEEDIYRLNHYTNLRPLWAADNLAKGSKLVTAYLCGDEKVLDTRTHTYYIGYVGVRTERMTA